MTDFAREKSGIVITCPKGLSPFLSGEVYRLGLPVLSSAASSVATEGTIFDAMKLNLFVRTGHRVLFLLREIDAENPDELYRNVSEIEWEKYLLEDGYLSVTSYVENKYIKDSRFANVKCKDAIVDRMNRICGRRPDSGSERDRAVISIYWKDDRCSVYLDTSGEPLSKRGYRKIPLKAPMQETLASAVVMATGWDGKGSFVNPMCGSGTLAIEAALAALNRAPGLSRKNFGFMHLRGFDNELWNGLITEAKNEMKKELNGGVIATDINAGAVEAARSNAAAAEVEDVIEFGVCDYSETAVPQGGGVVVINAEYGERMGEMPELEIIYKGIGDFFKKSCTGYTGYLFTGNSALSKKVGLRPKSKRQFFNGEIECRLLQYELYEGSKKSRRQKGGENAAA